MQLFESFTLQANHTGLARYSTRNGSKYGVGVAQGHDASISAILSWCYGYYNGKPIASGTNDTGTSVEVQIDTMNRAAVFYNPSSKKVYAGIRKVGVEAMSSYNITRNDQDGSAIFLAMMPTFLKDDEFSENHEIVAEMCSKFPREKVAEEIANNEQALHALLVLCDNMKWRIQKENLCNIEQSRVRIFSKDLTEYTPKTVICGNFEILVPSVSRNGENAGEKDEDFATRYILDENRVFSEEEQLLIPSIPKWYIVPRYLKDACKMVTAKKLARPVRNIMLRGEAGTGKTEAAKAMAAALHIPYVSLCCHPDMMITDFTGTILPKLESKSNGISSSIGDMPSFLDIQMDPNYAYSLLTNEEKDGVTEDEVIALMLQKAAESATSSGNGIEYEYCDSPLVQAIRNGWLCEIQEPAIIERPGVLTGLNSLLDTCQQVVLPTGEVIKRHPDCIIVVTTNTNYQGCKEINSSVISRMQYKKDTALPTEEELKERIKKITGFSDDSKLSEMIRVVAEMHSTCQEHMITDGSCGVRELIDWVQAYMVLGDIITAAECTIIPSASADPDNQEDLRNSTLYTHFANNSIVL